MATFTKQTARARQEPKAPRPLVEDVQSVIDRVEIISPKARDLGIQIAHGIAAMLLAYRNGIIHGKVVATAEELVRYANPVKNKVVLLRPSCAFVVIHATIHISTCLTNFPS